MNFFPLDLTFVIDCIFFVLLNEGSVSIDIGTSCHFELAQRVIATARDSTILDGLEVAEDDGNFVSILKIETLPYRVTLVGIFLAFMMPVVVHISWGWMFGFSLSTLCTAHFYLYGRDIYIINTR